MLRASPVSNTATTSPPTVIVTYLSGNGRASGTSCADRLTSHTSRERFCFALSAPWSTPGAGLVAVFDDPSST